VNERLYDQLGRLLKDDLRFNANANGEYYWTNNGGSKIKVGAHYDSYTFKGIQLYSWSTKSCLMNILTQDTVSVSTWVDQTANSGISMFTLEGREMLSGKLKGMGGFSGKENTDLATSVDGSEYLLGYSAAVVLTLTMLQSLKGLLFSDTIIR
jgi:hypothetical protein